MGKKLKVKVTRKLIVAPSLSNEQSMLRSLFGGGDKVMFNVEDSECRPKITGALMPYTFGDETESETAEIFGFIRRE